MRNNKSNYHLVIMLLIVFLVSTPIQVLAYGSSETQNFVYEQLFFAPPTPIRMPAEFEPMESVLIRYPLGISYQIIAEMAEDIEVVTIVGSASQQTTVTNLYISNGVNIDHCSFLIAPSDSYWTRDYGPWCIFTGNDELAVVDFIYNRPRPNDDAIPGVFAINQGLPSYFMSLIHTGGNYMTDGQGIAVSTDLVWTENPGLTHTQINQRMLENLGIETYHVVPDVNGEYIEHVDCWGKYLAPDMIMIREVPPTHSQYDEIEVAVDYFESQLSCYGTPYQVVRVYTPNNQPYTNSLILNNKVFVPIVGSSWDDDAIASYQTAMPGYEVLGFTGSWASTDALHCRAMGIPDRYMLYIEHTPLSDQQYSPSGFDVFAKIIPYSGESLKTGSPRLFFKGSSGSWDYVTMTPIGNDEYQGIIPKQSSGTNVSYFIFAEDNSGRAEYHPYIGEAGAHSFLVYGDMPNSPPDIPEKPSGPAEGKAGETYTYSTMTTDFDEDDVYYLWDWGDGTASTWLGPHPSGATVSTDKTWSEQGTYIIKVKAKDVYGNESDWSEPLEVSMPRTRYFIHSWVFNFIEVIKTRLRNVIYMIGDW